MPESRENIIYPAKREAIIKAIYAATSLPQSVRYTENNKNYELIVRSE